MIRDIRPKHLVPCHSRPLSGKELIYGVMTDYRDAIQFVHDQGIRGMNMGMTPDELVASVRLPQHLSTSPYLQEFYGAVSWSLRSLFSGNLGWFSGDAADLDPLASADMEKTVGIQFKDVDQAFSIYLRRGVAEIRKGIPENPDILARADSTDFKAMLAGIKSPVTTLTGFEYDRGNAISMGLFFRLFEPPAQKLAHMSF